MVQNNMEPWNDFLKQDYNNTQDTSVSTPNFSTTELQNAAPAGRSESQFFLFGYEDTYIDFGISRQFIRLIIVVA